MRATDEVTVRFLQGTTIMLMRNPDYKADAEQEQGSSRDTHSPRKMLLGQVVLFLLFAIAILLRSLGT